MGLASDSPMICFPRNIAVFLLALLFRASSLAQDTTFINFADLASADRFSHLCQDGSLLLSGVPLRLEPLHACDGATAYCGGLSVQGQAVVVDARQFTNNLVAVEAIVTDACGKACTAISGLLAGQEVIRSANQAAAEGIVLRFEVIPGSIDAVRFTSFEGRIQSLQMLSVVEPPVPRLSVTRTESGLQFTWSYAYSGWRLEQAQKLGTGTWSPIGIQALRDDCDQMTVTLASDTGAGFFRLVSP